MKRALLTLLVVGTAFASSPAAARADDDAAVAAASAASTPRDCTRIGAELKAAQAAQQQARARQADAWKVVVPFAVAGRYAQARAAGNEAAARTEALTRESTQRGCDAR